MKLRTVVAACAFALTCAPALADPTLTFSLISGSWLNPAPVPSGGVGGITVNNVASPGTSELRWGTPFTAPQQSGYDFTPAGGGTVAFSVPVPGSSLPGVLGEFDHLNFPIFAPQVLTSVQLQVTANITITDGVNPPANLGLFNFVFDFTHDETPNGGNPGGPYTGTCPYGTQGVGVNVNGCADKVTVTSNASSQNFNVNGVVYTLDILGFSQDGGATISNMFLTTENQNNKAGLYAIVKALENQVPEPGSLALIGLALFALGFIRRKSIS